MNINKEIVWHIVFGAAAFFVIYTAATHFSRSAHERLRFEHQRDMTILKSRQNKEVINLKHSNGLEFHRLKTGKVNKRGNKRSHKSPKKSG